MSNVDRPASPRATATALLVVLAAMTGCGGSNVSADRHGADPHTYTHPGISAEIPSGWDATGHNTSAPRDPELLLTAGSFDLSPVGHLPRGGSCSPDAAIDLEPDDGALIAVTKYSAGHLSPLALRRLPPRPRSLTLSPRNYGTFECSGESYDMQFREGGVGYKVDVWLDPKRVGPQVRADTVCLLNSLELRASADPPDVPRIRNFQAALVTPTAVRISWRLDSPADLALAVEGLPRGAAGVIPVDAGGSHPPPCPPALHLAGRPRRGPASTSSGASSTSATALACASAFGRPTRANTTNPAR